MSPVMIYQVIRRALIRNDSYAIKNTYNKIVKIVASVIRYNTMSFLGIDIDGYCKAYDVSFINL